MNSRYLPANGTSRGWIIPLLLLIPGLIPGPSTAAEPGTGTPLEILRGEIHRVSNVAELRGALANANTRKAPATLLLADGLYRLDAPGLEILCPDLVVRGASGNRDRVIVRGPDEGPNATVANIFLVAAHNVTIADLTLGGCRFHGIQVRGEHPFNVSGLRVHNCHLVDCNEQFIKGSSADSDPVGATDGIIESCRFEFSRGWAYQYYTGGIDIHKGVRWVVRDNLFLNLRNPAGQPGMAEHAIHFWKRCPDFPQDIVVERNRIVNCDRGIGFGLVDAAGGHHGGHSIIRNNAISNDGTGPRTDVGIGLEHASGVEVDNNTVFIPTYWAPIEYRFAGSSNVVFRNNLSNRPIQRRDDAPPAPATNNLGNASASWFRSPAQGDLHPADATVPAIDAGLSLETFSDDLNQRPRPAGKAWDIGAHEHPR